MNSQQNDETRQDFTDIHYILLYMYYLYSDGWIDADDLGCFKFLDSAVNLFWVEAQQKCQSIGGNLAEPFNARSKRIEL